MVTEHKIKLLKLEEEGKRGVKENNSHKVESSTFYVSQWTFFKHRKLKKRE